MLSFFCLLHFVLSVSGFFGRGPLLAKTGLALERVHIIKKCVFGKFSRIHAVRRVLRSFGDSWASPGILWGAPGARQPDQGHGLSEASCPSCFAVAGGRAREHQTAKHDGQLCRKRSSRHVWVQKPSYNTRCSCVVAPPGVQFCSEMQVFVFCSCCGVSPPPKGMRTKPS